MENPQFSSLGDSAIVITWGNSISREWNNKVIALSKALLEKPFEGFIDLVPAYSSLSIMYDLLAVHNCKKEDESCFEYVEQYMLSMVETVKDSSNLDTAHIEIPVCYDESLINDLAIICSAKKISKEEIIAMHTGRLYHVYMLGFLPGFSYMGEVDEQITMPRKHKPVKVKPGAVGIAGFQTGIYPVSSPGGWHIVGYTPYKMFDAKNAESPCLLRAGDTVQFKSVCIDDFRKIEKEIKT